MPSTVYKGDLAEVTFGHEASLTIGHGHFGGVTFSISTSGDISTITFASGSSGFFDSSSNLRYPKNLLVGSKMRVVGGGNYGSDKHESGHVYTIIENAGTTLKVTPAMESTGASTSGDELIVEALGTPAIDVGMTYNANANASDETVLTDQFVGLAATIALPETKVEVRRSHVVGVGRDVVVQEPQRFSNEGGSLETMMHSARWLYYSLGREAVASPSTVKATVSGASLQSIGLGDSYIEFGSGTLSNSPSVGEYILVVDTDKVLTPYDDEPATHTDWDGTQTQFHRTVRNEMRRVVAVDTTVSTAQRIHVDAPFDFDHDSGKTVKVLEFVDSATTTGSPNFDTSNSGYGTITNRQSRALFSGWHTPSFSIETSMRTRDVDSYGTGGYTGSQSNNAPGSTSDSKQLTRLYKGCKVKSWELTADADSEVKMKVDFDSLMCYTDTGRLEDSNAGDRFTAHRMFENVANGPAERKMAGIAPNTEKPFFFYNGTITAFGTALAQITNFSLKGNNNTVTHYTVKGSSLAEARNSNGKSLEQIPFGASRNPSLIVEGRNEYDLSMTIIPTDPLLWHEFRTNRVHGYSEPITLHLVKNGAGSSREEIYIVIDDYIITEAPLQIPEDKGVIKSELTIMPKHVKVVAHDSLYHC